MQSFESRTVGVDTAVLDIKVNGDENFHFTEVADIQNLPDAIYCAGGVTANILVAHSMVANNPARLYACIGTDKNGQRYQEQTPKTLGELQKSSSPTGIVGVVLMNDGTSRFDYVNLGAGTDLTVSKEEYTQPSSLVYVDLIQASTPTSAKYIDELLETNYKQGGIWSLNVAGANRYPNMTSVLNGFKYNPDIMFGNQLEYASLCGISSPPEVTSEVLRDYFPNPRMIVMTKGKEGADIIFEDMRAHIPATYVDPTSIFDDTGAGDCFHGTMIGTLSNKEYNNWTLNDIILAGKIASGKAGQVIQTYQNRLSTH